LSKIQEVDEREKKNIKKYCRKENLILRYQISRFDKIVNFRKDRKYIVKKSRENYYYAKKIVEKT